MAKNIVLKNALGDSATYDGVSKIVLKDETGLNVEYIERPYTPSGVPEEPNAYLCQLIDYDGTIIKSEYLFKNEVFTLPTENELPVHEKLVFEKYSSPFEIVNNSIIVEDQDITIGITYTTASGLTEVDITINKVTGLSVSFYINGTKDWGDGTSDSSTSHTYANYGDYTITCNGSSWNGSYIMGQNGNMCIRDIRLANITSIGNYAFSKCTSLTSITIPSSVTTLGFTAFGDCYSINSITIPEGVALIQKETFSRCYSLESIVIPNGVTSIGDKTFLYCYSLKSISIPNGVTNIGESSFNSCSSLDNITFPDSVTTIGNSVLTYCNSIKRVKLPSEITTIGTNMFQNCYVLSNVNIPSTITEIGSQAFNSCVNLKSISLPSGLIVLNSNILSNCRGVKSVAIPEGVTSIGDYAFYGCTSLTGTLKIPNTVTSIGSRAFQECSSVDKFDFSEFVNIPTLNATLVFYGIKSLYKIVVPDALYDEWIVATNWSQYANYIYKASEMPAE